MKTETIREESQFLSLAGVWNQLLQKSSADTVFLTFEWLSTWWRFFGSGKQLFIVLVKDGDRIIGAAPLMLTTKEGFRQLSFIGGTTIEAKDFIASDDCDRQQILEAILDAIQSEPGWDFFRWDGFREDSPNFIPLKTILFGHKELRPMLLDDDISPYISVDQTWEGYWSGLKRGVRNDIPRLLRILEREKGPVTYHSPKDTNEVACLMDRLIKFQLTRAREVTHRPSVLESAVTVEFYKSLACQLLTRGWLSLPVLSVEGETAALHFGFEYAGKYFYYMPTFNHSFEKYGVGKSLLLYLVRDAFGRGLTEFDLLLGNEPYKFSFNPKVRKLHSMVFFQQSFRGHASEVWFGRLRPRLEKLVKKKGVPFERLSGWLVRAKSKKHEDKNGGGASKQAGVPGQEEPSSKSGRGTMKNVVLTSHEASVTTKNISTVTLLKVGQYPFLVASMMLIPRLMGPVTYGEFALLISIITMTASLIDFGGGTDMFGRFVPEFEVRGESTRARKLASNILAMKGVIDLATLAFLFPVLYYLYSDRFPHAYFVIVAAIVLARDLQTVPYAVLFGSNKLVKFSSQEPMRRVMSLFFILILFHYFGLFGAVLSTLVVECFLGTFGFFWARKYFSVDNFRVDLGFLRPYLSFHFIFYVSSFALNTWQRLGNPIIEYLTDDPRQVALFDVPNQIFLITGTFALVIIASLIPIFSKFLLVGKEDKIVKWAKLIMKYTGILCSMTLWGFILAGPDLIPIVIGPAYKGIFPNGAVLLLGLYPMSVLHLGQVFSVVYKKPGKYLQGVCLGILTFLLASVSLVPVYSSMGCAIAVVVSCVAVATFMCISFGAKLFRCLFDGFKTMSVSLVFSPLLLLKGSLITNLSLLIVFGLGYALLLFVIRVLTQQEIIEVWTAIRHKSELEA